MIDTKNKGHLQLIPSDAVGLMDTGRLDPRLFDVTTLLAYGYDDRRAELPLLITTNGAGAARVTAAATTAEAAGARVTRRLPRLGAVAVRQDRKRASAIWQDLTRRSGTAEALPPGVSKVWLDGIRRPVLDVSVPLIGAPSAWQAGYTGKDVEVAVLDTGVDDTHPDLAGRVVARSNFTDGAEDDLDHLGHGTHVASTIAGSGAASSGRYRGVAPDAGLADGKVCVVDGCAESWILAGMDWAAAARHAQVVNLSLGGPDFPGVDPLEEAVNTLTAQYGTLFVIAAGNEGEDASVGSPASADAALAVGAVTKTDQLADFSSRGPRADDGGLKPDITAPGVDIVAARSKDGQIGEPVGDSYVRLSGTSMATPHVAGAAAILAQQHPDWTAGPLKATLMGSAKPNPALGVFAQGAGRVDVARAISQTIVADQASISFGTQLWPHNDDEVLTRTVTYHNSGAAAATVAIIVDATGPNGAAVPAGTFAVQPSTVTVPAGGDAQVTLTADTRIAGPDGYLTGALTAAMGDQTMRTPFAVNKEVESYTLTLAHTATDGSPANAYLTVLQDADFPAAIDGRIQYDPSGTVTVRVAKGRYSLWSVIFPNRSDRSGLPSDQAANLLVQPVLDVDADRSVAVDARLAKASSITVPSASARNVFALFSYLLARPSYPASGGLFSSSFDWIRSGQLGDSGPVEGLTSEIAGTWATLLDNDGLTNRAATYSISHHEFGKTVVGYQRKVAQSELATVTTSYHAGDDKGFSGRWYATDRLPGEVGSHPPAIGKSFPMPSTITHFFNSDSDAQWQSVVDQIWTDPDGNQDILGEFRGPWTGYQAGRSYAETWNHAVFGPTFPSPGGVSTGVTRTGDTIGVDLPLYGDGAGRDGYGGDSGSVALYRDAVKIGETAEIGWGEFTVPAEEATYRLQVHADRGVPYVLSTAIDAAWTFRSAHVDGDQPAKLPLLGIRFSPSLDDNNAAPAGRSLSVPVTVTAQPGAHTGQVRTLAVDVSYDDGATWTPASMEARPDGAIASLKLPKGNGFVSLRATAADSDGNSLEQTIVHAFRYGRTG